MLKKFQVYCKDDLVAYIEYDRGKNYIKYETYATDPFILPFGVLKNPDMKRLDEFFLSRCFPKERKQTKELLELLGLDFYDPELICERTHGCQAEDFMWFKYPGEHLY